MPSEELLPTFWIRPATLTAFCIWDSSPYFLSTLRLGIGITMTCFLLLVCMCIVEGQVAYQMLSAREVFHVLSIDVVCNYTHNLVFRKSVFNSHLDWYTIMISLDAVHIEDCEGWWLSNCCSSVAEHFRLKPGVLGSTPAGCRPFHFSLFLPHNFLFPVWGEMLCALYYIIVWKVNLVVELLTGIDRYICHAITDKCNK